MKLIFFSYENTEPESFSRIINPANARSELDRSYLFGGAAQMSICSRYNIMRPMTMAERWQERKYLREEAVAFTRMQ